MMVGAYINMNKMISNNCYLGLSFLLDPPLEEVIIFCARFPLISHTFKTKLKTSHVYIFLLIAFCLQVGSIDFGKCCDTFNNDTSCYYSAEVHCKNDG
jgi:hypothetical protein